MDDKQPKDDKQPNDYSEKEFAENGSEEEDLEYLLKGNLLVFEQAQSEIMKYRDELNMFEYTISHDLLSPLRIINEYTKILLESYKSEFGEESEIFLKKILASSEQMKTMLNNIIRLSKIQKEEMDIQWVNLSKIVEEIVYQYRFSEKENQPFFTIKPDLRVKADRRLIKIMCENLIDNSVKSTSTRDNPSIEFGNIANASNSFYIRDNGVGFDASYAYKMFKPFQRLHTRRLFTGLGIGLSIVDVIINRHNGEIWAEGNVGEGATFFFSLPSTPDRA